MTATVWREGHDAVAANVVWKQVGARGAAEHVRMVHAGAGTDTFDAVVVADEPGLWTFRVDAWSDPWATWRHAVNGKLKADQTAEELANDLEIGARLLQRVGRRPAEREHRDLLLGAANALRDTALPLRGRVAPAMFPAVDAIMTERPVRELITRGRPQQIYVDRERALFGSWYEFFPRSTGGRDETGRAIHGSFVTRPRSWTASPTWASTWSTCRRSTRSARCTARAATTPSTPGPATSGRRGRSARPTAGTTRSTPSWARSTTSTRSSRAPDDLGMEIALDFALQCAPDHPWVAAHPEWFTVRPDGTIAYAENPPKKYQDIYPVNFDNDPAGIYAESLRVVLHWVEHGVRIFRVDNPHTKPPNFWHWLIWQVKARTPTCCSSPRPSPGPARLFGLARLGFTQSYTYFTWRTEKAELDRVRAHARRACRRVPAEPLRQHPGHPPRVAADRRARRCSRSGPRWPRRCPRPGACTPASSSTRASR